MKFEAGKEYLTRGGEKVRVYATDGTGDNTIHGAIFTHGNWFIRAWYKSGHYYSSEAPNDFDIMPPKIKRWLNVYEDSNENPSCYLHPSKTAAEKRAGTGRIACIPIEYVEGEGLDDVNSLLSKA